MDDWYNNLTGKMKVMKKVSFFTTLQRDHLPRLVNINTQSSLMEQYTLNTVLWILDNKDNRKNFLDWFGNQLGFTNKWMIGIIFQKENGKTKASEVLNYHR